MPNSDHSVLEQPEPLQPPQQLLASDQSGQQPGASIAGASREKSTRGKHIDFLPLKQQRELRDKEQVIKDCIALKEANHGRLPRGESAAAMKKLKINSRQTLLNLIERYELHKRLYPEEPAVNALIELRGRPPSAALTPEHEKVALGVYLTTNWESILEPEKEGDKPPIYPIKMRPRVEFVYKLLSQVFPDFKATEDQLWHFLEKKKQSDGALFALARYGEKRVWMEYVPKTSNDVEAPNDRWQSDGRALPLVVRDDKDPSLTFTVTQVIVLDDFSRYVPAWTLKPRKEQSHSKKTSRIGINGGDVRLVLATAFWKTGFRPAGVYTDHGTENEAIEPHLKYLTDDNEPPIEMLYSKPGHPWGRGKVEVIGALIDSFLCRQPGFVADEDDLMCWRQAHANPNLLTFSQFRAQIAAYWKQWNTAAAPGKNSRKQIYDDSPQSSLPAPSLIRLAHFGLAEEWAEVSASDNGLYYRGEYYKPKLQDREAMYRWMNAAGSTRKVPLYVLPLVEGDDANQDKLIIACLDSKTWEEVIPVKSRATSARKHVQNQRSALNRKKQELGSLYDEMQAVLAEKYVLKTQLHALSGTPIIQRLDNVAGEEQLAADKEQNAAPSNYPVASNDTPPSVASDAVRDKDRVVSTRRRQHKLQPKRGAQQPKRSRSASVSDQTIGGDQSPKSATTTPLPEQLTPQDDDDTKVRERLRQLQAQRQQDMSS